MALPEFSLTKNKYDQNTFFGRVRHFSEVFNPFLLITPDSKLQEAKSLLERFAKGEVKNNSQSMNKKLWDSKMLTDAAFHPQTNEKIPIPFRFAAFVPMNIPITVGMLASKSTAAQLFWQWYNQSYNVAVNHSNGNKTHPMPPKDILKAYCSAVTVSCGLTIGLGKLVKPISRRSRLLGVVARAVVPFASVAAAGASNAFLIRINDIINGVEIKDRFGKVRGVSKVAGKKAVELVCMTRMMLPVLLILLPGIVNPIVQKSSFFVKRPKLFVPFNLTFITTLLFISIPTCIGMFPQESSIEAESVEERFRRLKFEDGSVVDKFFFNKGL